MVKDKETMIRLLEALFSNVKIYLFGSHARGDFSPTSDIDIAIDTGQKLTFLDRAKAKNVLEALTHIKR